VDRSRFADAAREVADADAAIEAAQKGLHRLTRLAEEARNQSNGHARLMAQAALEGVDPPEYTGPDVAAAERALKLTNDELAAMKTAQQQAVARRAIAREELAKEAARRISERYVELARELGALYAALYTVTPRPIGSLPMAAFQHFEIPAPSGIRSDDFGRCMSGVQAMQEFHASASAEVAALLPEIRRQ
jgi:hypothetical protein